MALFFVFVFKEKGQMHILSNRDVNRWPTCIPKCYFENISNMKQTAKKKKKVKAFRQRRVVLWHNDLDFHRIIYLDGCVDRKM